MKNIKMKNVFYILILSTMLYSCENSTSKSEKSSKVAEESKDFNGLSQLKGQTFYAYHQKNLYNGEGVSFLEDGRVRLGNSVCEVEMNSNINSDEITLKYNGMSCKFSFTDNNVKGDLVGNVLMKGQQIFLHIKSLKDNGSGIQNGYYELFHELKDTKDIERIILSNEKLLNEIDNKEKSETNSNSENRLSFSEIRGLLINTPDINDIEKYCGKPDDIYTVGDGKIYLFYNKAQLNGQTGTLLVFYSWTKHYIEIIEFHEPGSRIYLNKVRYMIAPSISN